MEGKNAGTQHFILLKQCCPSYHRPTSLLQAFCTLGPYPGILGKDPWPDWEKIICKCQNWENNIDKIHRSSFKHT